MKNMLTAQLFKTSRLQAGDTRWQEMESVLLAFMNNDLLTEPLTFVEVKSYCLTAEEDNVSALVRIS